LSEQQDREASEEAMSKEKIVAIGFLTEAHMEMLKGSMPKVFPFPEDRQFDDLLAALDEIDRKQHPR
jgi:hypothetical protein